MAECSYARCLQERRLIKRELMKWSKDMLHIVGLERVAEELMGRRKWKHYQETLTRAHLSTDQLTATINQLNIEPRNSEHDDTTLDDSNIKRETPSRQQQEQSSPRSFKVPKDSDSAAQLQSYEENHRHTQEHDPGSRKHHRTEETLVNTLGRRKDETPETETDAATATATTAERRRERIKGLESVTEIEGLVKKENNKPILISSPNYNPANNNNNNNSTTTDSVSAKTEVSDDDDRDDRDDHATSLRSLHHSELLANLRLRRVHKANPSSAAPTGGRQTPPPPTPPPPPSQPEPDPEPEPHPIDWKPNEKCYFCVDGKLLTVNAKGELVAESGSALSEADHAHRQIIDTESDSNDSCAHDTTPTSTAAESLTAVCLGAVGASAAGGGASSQRCSGGAGGGGSPSVNKLLASRLRELPANMTTSMDSMAAHLAAIRTISGQLYPNLDFNWLLSQQQQQQQQRQQQQQQQTNSATPTTSDTSAAAVSPALKDSPSSSEATGEQPLDLSSKPSPNSSISGDLKTFCRTKPSRAPPLPPGRRTYSDDDLSCALQDIISKKLGTRKAAVQYNIPRSTLRNKVYKLTMDEKRSSAPAPSELLQQLHQELELERDALSADEGEGEESNDSSNHPPPPPLEELANRIAASATLRKLCEASNVDDQRPSASTCTGTGTRASASCSPKPPTTTTSTAAALEQLKRQSATPRPIAAPPQTSPPPPQLAPILIDPNVLLQTLLLSAGALQNSAALQPKLDETVTLRDLFSAILLNSGINLKDVLTAQNVNATPEPANPESAKPANIMEQRLLLQQLQQHQSTPAAPQAHAHAHAHAHFAHRGLPKSDTPETSSSLDLNEASDDPSVILKIPSYKPAAGSSASAVATATTTTGSSLSSSTSMHCSNNSSAVRNDDSPHSQSSAQSPRIATSMLAAAVAAASGAGNASATAHHQPNSISVISPPLMRHSLSADSQSPPAFSLRDVIANSIHRTMNEQANKDAHAAAASMLGLGGGDPDRGTSNDYKTPSISVVKNIGGTDTSRFGKAPNLLAAAVAASPHNSHQQHHHHHHPHHAHLQHAHHSPHHLSRQEAAALAAGKGTRPKRGKYRNYDRDSLVEAVKAVQRGEMSVHRAGSYYGVPHSTLEYKVKERHLMRPRKREPKPQPLDSSSTTGSSSSSKANIPGHSTANNLDKLKSATAGASTSKLSGALKSNSSGPAFPSTSPNGLKLPMFDPSVAAAQLQYAPHLFWSHSAAAFGPLQMDYNRNASQSTGSGASTAAVSAQVSPAATYVNADILKSHIQRYQEESMRAAGSATVCPNNNQNAAHTPSPIASPMPGQNHHALHYKSARELAENLYDASVNANGTASSSFLDGIIRKTLDRKSSDVAPPPPGGALLDQLLVKKIPLPFANNRSNDYAPATATGSTALKRSGSPFLTSSLASASYGVDIKRERSSPAHSDAEEASNNEMDDHHSNRLSASGDGNNVCGASTLVQRLAQRSRMTSHDSDTDGSTGSLKSNLPTELLAPSSQHYNNTALGSGSSSNLGLGDHNGSGLAAKLDISSGAGGAGSGVGVTTSILQEKLGQIKSERGNEEHL